MGIWVTGTYKVSRQGMEIVRFFDITLRCLASCMGEAEDQLSGGPQSGGHAGNGFRTDMWPQDADADTTFPSPPPLRGLDFPEQDFLVPFQPACP